MQYKVIASPICYPEIIETKSYGVKVLDTHVNLEWLLRHFKAVIRYNKMTRMREVSLGEQFIFQDDVENSSLSRVKYLATLNYMPILQIDSHLDQIAQENSYHPIVDCILSNPWDGINRLDGFIGTLKSTNEEADRVIIKTWMTAAIAAAFSENGFTNHGVLVIQGPQGIGKTAWVVRLAPTECNAIAVGVLLDPKNKDSVINSNRFWINEIGELDATLNKSDIAHLKSYITSSIDNIRSPYARRENRLPRRTAYIATVNEHNFLVDTTGNRRWWVISATEIDYAHKFDMQQVWAEVYHSWKNGALTYLPKEVQALIDSNNLDHEKIDPIHEAIHTNYDWATPRTRSLTVTEIMKEIDYHKPTHGECTRAGKILTIINGKPARKSNGVKLHDIPQKLSPGFGRSVY
jgi:predicted P-loop ATPase